MKIYFRPSLYLFLRILVNSSARMPDFLRNLTFIYLFSYTQLNLVILLHIWKGLMNFTEAFECIHKIIECTVQK